MSDNGAIQINEKTIERLKRKIIIQENVNLKRRNLTESQMISWIKTKIEEEVKCDLNR